MAPKVIYWRWKLFHRLVTLIGFLPKWKVGLSHARFLVTPVQNIYKNPSRCFDEIIPKNRSCYVDNKLNQIPNNLHCLLKPTTSNVGFGWRMLLWKYFRRFERSSLSSMPKSIATTINANRQNHLVETWMTSALWLRSFYLAINFVHVAFVGAWNALYRRHGKLLFFLGNRARTTSIFSLGFFNYSFRFCDIMNFIVYLY